MAKQAGGKESGVASWAVLWLNSRPGWRAEKRHGGMYGVAGKADINGCFQGRSIQIELKREGGQGLSPIQQQELLKWAAAGAETFVAYGREGVRGAVMAVEYGNMGPEGPGWHRIFRA